MCKLNFIALLKGLMTFQSLQEQKLKATVERLESSDFRGQPDIIKTKKK